MCGVILNRNQLVASASLRKLFFETLQTFYRTRWRLRPESKKKTGTRPIPSLMVKAWTASTDLERFAASANSGYERSLHPSQLAVP